MAGRPVLMWSIPNRGGYPQWKNAVEESPVALQITLHNDRWVVLTLHHEIKEFSPSELALQIATELIGKMNSPTA